MSIAILHFSLVVCYTVILPAIGEDNIPFFAEEIIRTKPRFIMKLFVLVTLNFYPIGTLWKVQVTILEIHIKIVQTRPRPAASLTHRTRHLASDQC